MRFSDGETDTIEGVVLRASESELVANLKRGVTLKRMMSEQIRMRQKYPTTLPSSDDASGESKSQYGETVLFTDRTGCMTSESDEYAAFVEHPRFGHQPRFTGLDPSCSDDEVNLHWNTTAASEVVAQYEAVTGEVWPFIDFSEYSSRTTRIDNTAIVADLTRQTPATVPVTHYFDLERQCRDCKRPFIFFAEEQKHWYEELGFGLDSDCVRCVECRKRQQDIARQRKLYESLCHVEGRTVEQSIQMTDACLSLIETGVFTVRQPEREPVRSLPSGDSIGFHRDAPDPREGR